MNIFYLFLFFPLFTFCIEPSCVIPLVEVNLPSPLVADCVNVLTGDFCLSLQDDALPGHCNLVLKRQYTSSLDNSQKEILGMGWKSNFESHLTFHKDMQRQQNVFTVDKGIEGKNVFISGSKNTLPIFTYSQAFKDKGLTNCSQGFLSGKSNPDNALLGFKDKAFVYCDSRNTKSYFKGKGNPKHLEKEVSPLGYTKKFEYAKENFLKKISPFETQGNALKKVSFYDPLEDLKGSYSFKNSSKELLVKGNNGKNTLYKFYKEKGCFFLEEVIKANGFVEKYRYDKGCLSEITHPLNRVIKIDYKVDGEELPLHLRDRRVTSIKASCGLNPIPQPLYNFEYDFKVSQGKLKGSVVVKDALNSITEYKFNTFQRLEEINHKKMFKEKFLWDGIYLKGIEIVKNTLKKGVYYSYDEKGNVLEEKIVGSITSLGSFDNKIIKQTFSKNRHNNLLSKSLGDLWEEYEYYKDSTLLKKKFTRLETKILTREFFKYDKKGLITEKIQDDGLSKDKKDLTGITERKISSILYNKMGLPIEIQEKYLELATGEEKLFHRTVYGYNENGNVIEESHFDDQDTFAYKKSMAYDASSNPIFETDFVGNSVERVFDVHNNLLEERGPNKEYVKKYTYDFRNQPILEEVIGPNVHLKEQKEFNPLDLCIKSIDHFGNVTECEYDALKRITRVKNPLYEERFKYDPLGFLEEKQDSSGRVTKFVHNIEGKPLYVLYPDGRENFFEYNLQGFLIKALHSNKTYTVFERDPFDRVLKETLFSAEGVQIASKESKYTAFHLIEERDPSGVATIYSYNDNGTLKELSREGVKTAFFYDSLGRSTETRRFYNETDYLSLIEELDPLNRIIEKKEIDSFGVIAKRTTFKYDAEGHVSEKREHREKEEITSYFEDFSQKKEINPLGEERLILADYTKSSFQKIEIDPLGEKVIEVFDCLKRVVEKIKEDPEGKTVEHFQYTYSPSNQVLSSHSLLTSKKISFSYDAFDHLIEEKDSDKTITSYVYNALGEKIQKITPDGESLFFSYDLKGRLASLEGKGIHYLYSYDPLDNLILIKDLIHDRETKRIFNSRNQLVEEDLGNGLKIFSSFDLLNRLLTLHYPDGKKASYDYEGFLLKTVTLEDKGKSYTHNYTYNAFLQPLTSGLVSFSYDSLGRIENLTSSYFNQSLSYDTNGKITSLITNGNKTLYRYDPLDQLLNDETHSYCFDESYNIHSIDEKPFLYDENDKLVSSSGDTFCYDLKGNLIQKNETFFSYDGLNRLIKASSPSGTYLYTYDSFNRRLTKNDTSFLYLDKNEIGAFSPSKTPEIRILGLGKGAEIGASLWIEFDNTLFIPLHDYKGSITALLSIDGFLEQRFSYTAFGENSSSSKNPWRYLSKRFDEETGFIFFGERYYDASCCRFITKDPLYYDGGKNLYAYVHNNPLLYSDLYGLYPQQFDQCPRVPENKQPFSTHYKPRPNLFSLEQRKQLSSEGVKVGYITKNNRSKAYILYINGMNNTLEDCIKNANYLAMKFNATVCYIYNDSVGLAVDCVQYGTQIAGIKWEVQEKIIDMVPKLIDNLDPDEHLTVLCHSQGGQFFGDSLKYIDPKYYPRIICYTFGSAKFISANELYKVINYVSDTDPIPLIAQPLIYFVARLGFMPNVKFLKTDALIEHSFDCNTYQTEIDKISADFKDDHGL